MLLKKHQENLWTKHCEVIKHGWKTPATVLGAHRRWATQDASEKANGRFWAGSKSRNLGLLIYLTFFCGVEWVYHAMRYRPNNMITYMYTIHIYLTICQLFWCEDHSTSVYQAMDNDSMKLLEVYKQSLQVRKAEAGWKRPASQWRFTPRNRFCGLWHHLWLD